MEEITLEHALMAEEKAKHFLRGKVVRLGGRVMDPKAQVVGLEHRHISLHARQEIQRRFAIACPSNEIEFVFR